VERVSDGSLHATYKVGDIKVTSLRDGYVDMPVRRLRQPGDKPFGDDLLSQAPLFDGAPVLHLGRQAKSHAQPPQCP
jgi:hypothetical protein